MKPTLIGGGAMAEVWRMVWIPHGFHTKCPFMTHHPASPGKARDAKNAMKSTNDAENDTCGAVFQCVRQGPRQSSFAGAPCRVRWLTWVIRANKFVRAMRQPDRSESGPCPGDASGRDAFPRHYLATDKLSKFLLCAQVKAVWVATCRPWQPTAEGLGGWRRGWIRRRSR